MLLQVLALVFLLFNSATSITQVSSFEEMAKAHCQDFSVQMLWRLSTGRLSEKYGDQYFDIDCYIRQFVRKDGITLPFEEQSDDEDEQEESKEDKEEEEQQEIPNEDPLVIEYSKGLSCLPSQINKIEAVYAIWRFIRFVVQHDYAYEWMRAKVRGSLGYQSQRHSSWMDGEQATQRLRLDKLFSNQFYEYVDKLMFKQFLYPLMTFLHKNTILALSEKLTKSGSPILVQSLSTHNYLPQVFIPYILKRGDKTIFTYTIPGIPLLLAGNNKEIGWAFTGVLVDRSNVEQIEIVGDKFYNHDTEEWIKLNSEEFQITGSEGKKCSFINSPYGALYTKRDKEGKLQEYISRWHQKEPKVRVIFSDVLALVEASGNIDRKKKMQFPFNSIMFVNETGIYQYLCPQSSPSYFLYPDMFQPQPVTQRWVTTSKKYMAVSNSLLTTMKQMDYHKGLNLSPLQQQIAINIRKHKQPFTQQTALQFVLQLDNSLLPQLKKQKNIMMKIYRKVKFIYMPDAEFRKKCDQIINLLEKWDEDLSDQQLAPIFILWNYFLREYTFNYISASKFGSAIAKHKVLSERYWTGQMQLWEKGTSYGECESFQYDQIRSQVNGTGHNSSCYLNIIRGINSTRQILEDMYNGQLHKISLSDFTGHKILDLTNGIKLPSHIQQAFLVHYSKNILFSSEIGSQKMFYHHSYKEVRQQINLNKIKSDTRPPPKKEIINQLQDL